MKFELKSAFALASFALAAVAAPASAQLVNLGPGSFTPLAPVITFDEQPAGTINPVYTFPSIPGLGTEVVSFAGAFQGQTVVGSNPKTITGLPTGPLTLNTSVNTVITGDGASTTSPILSGDPTYNGPISVLFSQPVAAVGLKGGYFDALNSTTIQAFDSTGAPIGSITNSVLGFEFYGLEAASGNNVIAGISFYITGNEPAGFDIDNLTFGSREQVNPTVPEPGSVALLISGGLTGAGFLLRRKYAKK